MLPSVRSQAGANARTVGADAVFRISMLTESTADDGTGVAPKCKASRPFRFSVFNIAFVGAE